MTLSQAINDGAREAIKAHLEQGKTVLPREMEGLLQKASKDSRWLEITEQAAGNGLTDGRKLPTLTAKATLLAVELGAQANENKEQWQRINNFLIEQCDTAKLTSEARRRNPTTAQWLNAAMELATRKGPTATPIKPEPAKNEPIAPPKKAVIINENEVDAALRDQEAERTWKLAVAPTHSPNKITVIEGTNLDEIAQVALKEHGPEARILMQITEKEPDISKQETWEEMMELEDQNRVIPTQGRMEFRVPPGLPRFANKGPAIELTDGKDTFAIKRAGILLDVQTGRVLGLGEEQDLTTAMKTSVSNSYRAQGKNPDRLVVLHSEAQQSEQLNQSAYLPMEARRSFDKITARQKEPNIPTLQARFPHIEFSPETQENSRRKIPIKIGENNQYLLPWNQVGFERLEALNLALAKEKTQKLEAHQEFAR